MAKIPRKNKTKSEIVADLKTIQNTDRMRKIVQDVVYPFLLELNDTIGFTKIFLQSAATAVDSTFSEMQRTVKIEDLLPKLKEVFSNKDKQLEMDKYIKLFELLKDESVFNFSSMIQYMPRVIEQYFTKEADKHPVLDIPINKILG